MDVEEATDGIDPQQVFAEYGDNGELDLDYGGLLAEVEQDPETPLHSVPAAYEESPPPRLVPKATFTSKLASRHLPWSRTKPTAEDTAGGSCQLLTRTPPCHSALFSHATKCQHQAQTGYWMCWVIPASISSSVQPGIKCLPVRMIQNA